MRPNGHFHPEWGYLAPAPGFLRTMRVALIATAVGATAGAAVVFSLSARSTTERSTIVSPRVHDTASVDNAPQVQRFSAAPQTGKSTPAPLPTGAAVGTDSLHIKPQQVEQQALSPAASPPTAAVGTTIVQPTQSATVDTAQSGSVGSAALGSAALEPATPADITSSNEADHTIRHARLPIRAARRTKKHVKLAARGRRDYSSPLYDDDPYGYEQYSYAPPPLFRPW